MPIYLSTVYSIMAQKQNYLLKPYVLRCEIMCTVYLFHVIRIVVCEGQDRT